MCTACARAQYDCGAIGVVRSPPPLRGEPPAECLNTHHKDSHSSVQGMHARAAIMHAAHDRMRSCGINRHAPQHMLPSRGGGGGLALAHSFQQQHPSLPPAAAAAPTCRQSGRHGGCGLWLMTSPLCSNLPASSRHRWVHAVRCCANVELAVPPHRALDVSLWRGPHPTARRSPYPVRARCADARCQPPCRSPPLPALPPTACPSLRLLAPSFTSAHLPLLWKSMFYRRGGAGK